MTSKFTQDQWSALLAESISTIESLSKLKGGEYASDLDRLANFRRNAEQTGVSMATVWSVYYNKHHDAVMQWVRDQNQQVDRPRAEPLVGRVDDMIVYLLLLKAILAEQQELPVELDTFVEPYCNRITIEKPALFSGKMIVAYIDPRWLALYKCHGWTVQKPRS